MPIYEYRCASCGHQQEFLQKVSDAPVTVCPQCGKPELAKMLTAAGFQLKGSGWYATDFRNQGAAPVKAAEGAKPAEGAKSADGAKGAEGAKGEAKPAGAKGEGGGGSSTSGSSGAGGSAAC